MEYDKQQFYGSVKKSKKESKAAAALRLVHHLFEEGELAIIDKEEKKKQPKKGIEQEDSKEVSIVQRCMYLYSDSPFQVYEEANPTPLIDCPADFTAIRDEIWRRFEYEGLPDPIFCADTEKILIEGENKSLNMLNSQLSLSKEKMPEIIVFTSPVTRDQ